MYILDENLDYAVGGYVNYGQERYKMISFNLYFNIIYFINTEIEIIIMNHS